MAAMKVSPEPTAIGVNWSGVMPFVLARYCVRPCVLDVVGLSRGDHLGLTWRAQELHHLDQILAEARDIDGVVVRA